MGNTISFPFLSSAHQKEILSLQASSIFKQINSLQTKEKQICHLQEEMSYLRIEEQLQSPSLQLKITDLEQVIKKRICSFPMLSGNERSISFLYLMSQTSMKKIFLQKLVLCK